ncbi:MAG: aminoglycoside phosphotransferase family protein [Asgard group archaeon]|nr:aminoglycoside phosphotransferase family protein [Asgard group archaeon]
MDITESQVVEICKKYNYDFISFELLGIGAFNLNYLLKTKQDKFVLRIENNDQFHFKKDEYEILRSLNGKFGPKVYFFDDSKKIIPADYLIEEFIDVGEHPPAVASDEFIETMGKWYRRLHLIKIKKQDSTYDLVKAFNFNYNKYSENKEVLEKNDQEIIDKLLEKALKILKSNNNIFSRRKYLSLTQGDPTRSNIFYSNKTVKLIDWEFAMYHYREYDLAFFVWSYLRRDEKRKLTFFKHAGYPTTDFSRKQFELMYLIRCLDMLAWSIERLSLIKSGKIDLRQTNSIFEEVLYGIREDFQVIENALANPFL